jgi:hypothetical protein
VQRHPHPVQVRPEVHLARRLREQRLAARELAAAELRRHDVHQRELLVEAQVRASRIRPCLFRQGDAVRNPPELQDGEPDNAQLPRGHVRVAEAVKRIVRAPEQRDELLRPSGFERRPGRCVLARFEHVVEPVFLADGDRLGLPPRPQEQHRADVGLAVTQRRQRLVGHRPLPVRRSPDAQDPDRRAGHRRRVAPLARHRDRPP